MAIRRSRRRRIVNDDIPTTMISAPINWTVIIALVAAVVLGVPAIIFSLRLLDVLSETHLMIVGAIIGTIGLVVITTLCWSWVVKAYSQLRSKEDRAEELAELNLYRAIQGGAAPNVAPTYHTGAPMDQTVLAQLLEAQRPTQVPATVIDFEQPVDFN